MERNFDLEDAIRNGVSPEQMLADFQKQLAQAQQEVAMEKAAATEDLNEARECMVDAIIDYLIAVGLIDEDAGDTADMANDLVDAIREAEKELMATKPLLDMFRRMKAENEKEKEEKSPDDVIGEFLKSLR